MPTLQYYLKLFIVVGFSVSVLVALNKIMDKNIKMHQLESQISRAIQAENGLKTISLDLQPYLASLPYSISYDEEVDLLSIYITNAYNVKKSVADNYASWILQSSTYSETPELILAALIMTESTYRGNVTSSVGAVGPTQIRMKYWRELCPFGDKNEKENIICGGMILSHYYNNNCSQDWACALQLYNVGPTNFKQEKYKQAGKRYLNKIKSYTAMLEKEHLNNDIASNLKNVSHTF